MNRKDTPRLNASGIRLRRTFEQRALRRMIVQLEDPDASTELLCKMLHVYCELIRHDLTDAKAPRALRRAPTALPQPAGSVDAHRRDRAAYEDTLRSAVRDIYGLETQPDAPVAAATGVASV